MWSKKIFLISVVTVYVALFSCKKNDTGGEATVVAFPKHHAQEIKGATVYVKFGATELPSDPTTNYDMKVLGDSSENHIHIEHLRYGKYYLYAVGYDSTIMQQVTGGEAVKIRWKERKEEIDVDIHVTE